MPNADTEGRVLFKMIEEFVQQNPERAKAFTSLGQLRYLSCLKHVDAVVGNSSSGLAEAPSFQIGTVNIGDRQRGRLKAASVIDCEPDHDSIRHALEKLYSSSFQKHLASVRNPYGEGGASVAIVKTWENTHSRVYSKEFYNLPDWAFTGLRFEEEPVVDLPKELSINQIYYRSLKVMGWSPARV